MNTKQNLADLYRTDPRKACRLALRRTAKIKNHEKRLEECNRLLECFGVEAITGEWQNGYWCNILAVYVNTGDTYATTIMYHREKGYMVTSWGDYVERNAEKEGIA